jgi:serine protease Do
MTNNGKDLLMFRPKTAAIIMCLILFTVFFSAIGACEKNTDITDKQNQAPIEVDEKSVATLEETSKAFVQVSKKAIPAVVSVQVEKTIEGSSMYERLSPFEREFFERFFGPEFRRRPERKQQGQGSGFLVSRDGYILTNNHVVGEADKITVKLSSGEEKQAELIGTDPKTDVAVIKIKGDDYPFIKLGNSEELMTGEWVIAVGNPFGLDATVTVGVVSALQRGGFGIVSEDGEVGYEDFIQTDAAINPGNSGGPLLNINGEAIGINTFIVSRSGGYMGIGFAIPINMAKNIKDQLINNDGKIERGFLGITMQDVSSSMAEYFELDEARGVVIREVLEDSPADKSGLEEDDVILEVNGKVIDNSIELRNIVAFIKPGKTVDVVVWRDGKKETIEVEIGVRDQEKLAAASKAGEKFGFSVQKMTEELAENLGYDPDSNGVVVAEVERGTSAFKKGLRRGMLIISVDRKTIKDMEDFKDAISKAANKGKALLLVQHENYAQYIVVYAKDK